MQQPMDGGQDQMANDIIGAIKVTDGIFIGDSFAARVSIQIMYNRYR